MGEGEEKNKERETETKSRLQKRYRVQKEIVTRLEKVFNVEIRNQ